MTEITLSESEMRSALGLDPEPPKHPKPSVPLTYTLVELSVRTDGGKPQRFEYRSGSISTLTAQLEAEKAARDEGHEVLEVLDINQISE